MFQQNLKIMEAYPIVSFRDIIDIFHAMLFWKKSPQEPDREVYLQKGTFGFAFKIMVELDILPHHRVLAIRESKVRAKEFLKRVHVLQQWDNTPLFTVADKPGKMFVLRVTNREMTQGRNVPEPGELFSRTVISLTQRGVAVADVAVRAVSHLITEKTFLAKSAEIKEKMAVLHPSAKIAISKKYKQNLDEKIWGPVARDDEELKD